ncbi:MAG: hypothetical protein OXG24_01055 [Gammaproteobacteria bacterium]|nr:hypothetical protein [Gammaproteobacteria bacterium]
MAQLSGVYVGIQGAISQSDADYSKVLDNTHPDNATTVAGMRFETSNTGDGNLGNIGLVVGYRKALDSGFYGVQLEANTGSGRVSGFVSGDGVSQLRAQYGEAWPETFDVASSTEFGVTLQWGRELLDTNWTAITGYYFLIGAKRANVELDTRYELGCFTLTECVGPQFETGEFSYEASGQVYAFGGGVEHAFSEKFVAQLELRLETSIEDDWEDVYENGTVRVIPSLEMQNFRFTLSLSRFL